MRREYLRRLKKAFDARGIEIPYPHLTLYAGAEGRHGPANSACAVASTPVELTMTGTVLGAAGGSVFGLAALVVFALAYVLVIAEEFTRVRKSTPVIVAAGVIWVLVALPARGEAHGADDVLRHNLVEYAGCCFSCLAAMTFVNTLEERHVFVALRHWCRERSLLRPVVLAHRS